jgi:biopolymer transport protein ExbB
MAEWMMRGGPMMWVLLATSVVATVIFLQKAFDLHRAQINWRDFLHGIFNILRRRNIVEAVSMCEETPGPIAGLARAAILHYDEDHDSIRRAMEEAGMAEIPRLEKYMIGLATVAHVAPALGLLGTILGMMRMLAVFQQKGPLIHAGDLMAGLLEALYPAAAGIAIGILAFVGYNFLAARIASIVADMELAAADILAFLTRRGAEDETGR